MGIRASATTELIFKDCIIPKENLFGKEGQGFKYAMKALDGGRIGMAAQAVGIAQGAIDETVKYLNQRQQFGKTIGTFKGIYGAYREKEIKIWNISDILELWKEENLMKEEQELLKKSPLSLWKKIKIQKCLKL